jgi:YD repeat-containing protein
MRWDRVTSRSSAGLVETFGYDDPAVFGKGRLTSLVDASGGTRYAYNGAGQLTRQINTIQGLDLVTDWSYSADGFLTSLNYPAGGLSIGYGYDAYGASAAWWPTSAAAPSCWPTASSTRAAAQRRWPGAWATTCSAVWCRTPRAA